MKYVQYNFQLVINLILFITFLNCRVAFMESLTTADIEGMPVNTGSLSVFTNEKVR